MTVASWARRRCARGRPTRALRLIITHLEPASGDLVMAQEFHDPLRGAREQHPLVVEQPPHVHSGQPVHVLLGGDQVYHHPSVEMGGKRKLQDYPVDGLVRVELPDQDAEVFAQGCASEVVPLGGYSKLLRCAVLAVDIDLRWGVVAYEDRGELRLHAPAHLHHLGLLCQTVPDLVRECPAVHQDRSHLLSITTRLPSIFSLPSTKSFTARG